MVTLRAALVTTREAANMLGLAGGTVRAQIRKGKLKAEKRGRDLFLELEEVKRYARDVQPKRRGGRPKGSRRA